MYAYTLAGLTQIGVHMRERGISDSQVLQVLNLACGSEVLRLHEQTQDRINLHHHIPECAEDGKVAIVSSGMDCDCSRWENSVSLVDANWQAVSEWINRFDRNCEGPQSFYIEHPSIARRLTRSSRDLVLEAFENGHPHCVSV